ncbi:MAG TPA: ATP-binding protein [Candidatus Limnocylindrales bacterium]
MSSTRPPRSQTVGIEDLGAAEILSADPNAVLLVDDEGTIVFANAAAAELTRHPVEALEGLSVDVLIPRGWRRHTVLATENVEGARVRREIVPIERADGSQLLVEWSNARVEDPGLTFSVLVDVTQREAAQRRVRTLAAIATALAGAVTEEDVARMVVEHVVDALGATSGVVGLVTDGHLRLVAAVGIPAELAEQKLVSLGDDVPLAEVVRRRRPIVDTPRSTTHEGPEGADDEMDPRLRRAIEGDGAALIVALPFLVEGRPVGALSLAFDGSQPRRDDLDFLETLAANAAQALERARLFVRERSARERAAAFAALNGAVLEARSPADVGSVLLDAAMPAFAAVSGALWLVDPLGEALELVEARGFAGVPNSPHRTIPLDSDLPAARAVRTGEGIRLSARPGSTDLGIDLGTDANGDGGPEANGDAGRAAHPDAGADTLRVSQRSIARETTATAVVLPLTAPGRTIGALGLSFERPTSIGPTELAQMRGFADSGAAAIARSVADEKERRTRRLFDAVVGQLPVGLLVAEAPSGRILFANDLLASMLGATVSAIRDLETIDADAIVDATNPDGSPIEPDERPIVRAVREGVTVEDVETIVQRADGSRIVALVSAAPVRDIDGRIVAGVSTLLDISSRAEALAARDAFIGILSHELRTPITTIYAGARLLAAPSIALDPETRADVAEDIAVESERLRRLVEDLLVISRVEQGAELARSEPILVGHVVRAVVDHEKTRRPSLRIQLDVEPGLPPANGDDGYVEQIVHNLLSNAAKYGPATGPIEVTVRGEPNGVTVRVADGGPGIEPGEEERVFHLFYRSAATSRRASGAGIGLYTCRTLVSAMGGEIWARRRDEGGTEVGFRLPLFETE